MFDDGSRTQIAGDQPGIGCVVRLFWLEIASTQASISASALFGWPIARPSIAWVA